MAAEVGSIQAQAQERVYAESRELAAKEGSVYAAQLEMQQELLKARLEAEQLQLQANSFSETANADDSSAKKAIEEVASQVGDLSRGMAQATEHYEHARHFSEATADHAYQTAIRVSVLSRKRRLRNSDASLTRSWSQWLSSSLREKMKTNISCNCRSRHITITLPRAAV